MKPTAFLVWCSAVALAACSSADPGGAHQTGEIVGVTDLSELEAELGMEKDVRDGAGKFVRSDERLKGGPCYRETVGSSAGDEWELRRYKTGAAFFAKQRSPEVGGPGGGPARPVVCVDVDIDEGDPGAPFTMALRGFQLDAAVRYHLGRPRSMQELQDGLSLSFQRGSIEMEDAVAFCNLRIPRMHQEGGATHGWPGLVAAADARKLCTSTGGDEANCASREHAACRAAVAADAAGEPLERPSAESAYIGAIKRAGLEEAIAPAAPYLAYRYAQAHARRSDVHSMTDDPVGRFVAIDDLGVPGADTAMRRFRYERLDAYELMVQGVAAVPLVEVLIAPKEVSDARREALVQCTRPLTDDAASQRYVCRGL